MVTKVTHPNPLALTFSNVAANVTCLRLWERQTESDQSSLLVIFLPAETSYKESQIFIRSENVHRCTH